MSLQIWQHISAAATCINKSDQIAWKKRERETVQESSREREEENIQICQQQGWMHASLALSWLDKFLYIYQKTAIFYSRRILNHNYRYTAFFQIICHDLHLETFIVCSLSNDAMALHLFVSVNNEFNSLVFADGMIKKWHLVTFCEVEAHSVHVQWLSAEKWCVNK